MKTDVVRQIGAVVRQVGSREYEGKLAPVVVAIRTYNTTVEDVWDAITSAERIPRWFLPSPATCVSAAEISTGDEIKLIIKGWVTGEGSGPLDAQKAVNAAKQNALRKARKEMLQAIRAEDDRNRSNAIIPIDVTEVATGKSDELVQVP